VLIGAAALLAAPLGAGAQPAARTARVGRLSPLSAETDAPFMNALRQGLQELGWVEGRSFTLVTRFAEGRADRLPRLAASLDQDGVDVIVVGSNPGALAARKATSSIPIVMVTTGDPITPPSTSTRSSRVLGRPTCPSSSRRPSSWSSISGPPELSA